jgi:hypothetical protein
MSICVAFSSLKPYGRYRCCAIDHMLDVTIVRFCETVTTSIPFLSGAS